MFDLASALGNIIGGLGFLTAIGSVVYQRRQTQLMEVGLERAIEVKITRELDVPEGETDTGIESKLRAVINRRLSDNRTKMRQEFGPRLDKIEAMLHDSRITDYNYTLMNLSKYLADEKVIADIAKEANKIRDEILVAQERILAESGRYSDDIALQGRDIEALRQQIEEVRSGIGYQQDRSRAQIRSIAEQLLRMTGQE